MARAFWPAKPAIAGLNLVRFSILCVGMTGVFQFYVKSPRAELCIISEELTDVYTGGRKTLGILQD